MGPIQFQYVNIQNSTITNDGRHLQVTVIKNESGTVRYVVSLNFVYFRCKEMTCEHARVPLFRIKVYIGRKAVWLVKQSLSET